MRVRRFEPGDRGRWEEFLLSAKGATLHHTRRFLEYHGDRFEDYSLLCEDGTGGLQAVLPAARDPHEASTIVSHPGATIGGIALGPGLAVQETIDVARVLVSALREAGFSRLIYKTRPSHVADQPFEIDQYILWRMGATVHRIDLWNAIDLNSDRVIGRRRRRALRQASGSALSVTTEDGETAYRVYHDILTENLARRHNVAPTHSIDEMLDLRERLGEDQVLWIARDSKNNVVAGEWVLRYRPDVWHTQYIASNSMGRESNAIDFLNNAVIETAVEAGARALSFGASTEQAGSVLNANLFDFKAGFGGGSIAHVFLGIDLTKLDDSFNS